MTNPPNDDDVIINGIKFKDIFEAMDLLQKAGLDTSSVTMSLCREMGKLEGSQTKE